MQRSCWLAQQLSHSRSRYKHFLPKLATRHCSNTLDSISQFWRSCKLFGSSIDIAMTVPHPEFDGIDRSPLGYEFRIFPPAQPHSLNPGSLVFVNLRSDKNSGLAVIQPAQQPVGETSTAAAEVEAHPSQQQAPAEPSQQCTSKDQRGTAGEYIRSSCVLPCQGICTQQRLL